MIWFSVGKHHTIAAQRFAVQIGKQKFFYNSAVGAFFCLIAQHCQNLFALAAVIPFSVSAKGSRKNIPPTVYRTALPCRTRNFKDNQGSSGIIQRINILIKQNIFAYFLRIIQNIPNFRNQFLRVFHTCRHQLFRAFLFLHAKQNNPSVCIRKR